jgi:deoxyribodipyrimidine photo-lyase
LHDSVESLTSADPRVRWVNAGMPRPDGRCVVYWMQRAQRAADNPALNVALKLGNTLRLPVVVLFALSPSYPGAQRRHYRFMLDGLAETKATLEKRGVPMLVRVGEPPRVVADLVHALNAAVVIGDENPVRVAQQWRARLARTAEVPFALVDADVVVPSRFFPKQEYAARTLRPKIRKLMGQFLALEIEPSPQHNFHAEQLPEHEPLDDVTRLLDRLGVGGAGEVPSYPGGAREALRRLGRFLDERLPRYGTDRNEPVPYSTSELSAHLHFGQISPVRLAVEALERAGDCRESVDSFIEELVVRRELAINYVWRNPRYDSLQGCPEWALRTLENHRGDPRPFLYTLEQLETAQTHDPLWNAAQNEMRVTGRMHNYLRMYWAKKILEWSPDAETAFAQALDLNDRYEMDGRDPNGYVGVAWAIGGLHDRPWPERPIFGTVRFMSYESTRKKFDSAGYIRYVRSLMG